MRLLIISHTAHYLEERGPVGWGATIREISHLSKLFDEVVHIACLHSGPPPKSSLPYAAKNLCFVPVPPAGGRRLGDKIEIFFRLPRYLWAILRELPKADAVHVRAPANISFLAMVLLAFVKRPQKRWIKYAGNWRPDGPEPSSYRFQRWWLRRNFSRAQVTVNGRWPGDGRHIHAFPNPCMTAEEYARARCVAQAKRLKLPITLIFAGALLPKKGATIAVETLAFLKESGMEARLVVVGDGPEKPRILLRRKELRLEHEVEMLGFVPHPLLAEHYTRAQFVLLPSSSEGWPKVLGEGMAYGAVPIAGAISSIPQVLQEAGGGCALDSYDPRAYAEAIRDYWQNPERWQREKEAASTYAERFTYEAHVKRVAELLGLPRTVEDPAR